MKTLTRLLKWLIIAIAGLISIGFVLSLLLLIFLDDDDYRSASIVLFERLSQGELTIDGDYRLNLSLHPTLNMTDVRLVSDSGRYSVQAGHVAISLYLPRLWSGLIWFENLELDDVSVTINALAQKPDAGSSTAADLFPVFEQARITNFRIDERHDNKQRATGYSIASLNIGQRGRADNLKIVGTGSWQGKAIDLSGDLGPIQDLLNPAVDYPVNIKLKAPETELLATGTLRGITSHGDIQLNIEFHTQEPSTWLDVWFDGFPLDGTMSANARLVGSLKALRLTDLNAEMVQPDVFRMQMNGELGIGRFPADTELTFTANLMDPSHLQSLLAPSWPALSEARLEGELRHEDGQLQLQNATLSAQTREGLDLTLAGSTALGWNESKLSFEELTASLDFKAPMTTALQPLLATPLPRLGPMFGHLQLTSDGKLLNIENANITAGDQQTALARVSGRLQSLPITTGGIASGIDLKFTIQSNNTKNISRSMDWNLPEIGPVRGNARLVGDSKKLSLRDIELQAGQPTLTQLSVRGKTDLGPPGKRDKLHNGKFNLQLSTPSVADLSNLFDESLPDIGPINGKLQLSAEGGHLSARNIKITAGEADGLYLQGEGIIQRINWHPRFSIDGLQLSIAARTASTRVLESLVKNPLPEFGPISGTARLEQEKSQFALQNITLVAGRKDNPLWSAEGRIHDLLPIRGIDLNFHADTQTTAMFKAWTGEYHPDLGRFQGRMRLTGMADRLSIPSLDLESSLDGVYHTRLSGSISEVGRLNRFDLTHQFDISEPDRFNELFEVDILLRKPVKTHGRLTGRQGVEQLTTTIRTGSSEARVELTRGGGKDHSGITGKIDIPLLHLADLPLTPEDNLPAKVQTVPEATLAKPIKPLFSRTAFDLNELQDIDTDLEIHIDELVGTDTNIDSVQGHLSLHEGQLHIAPLRFQYEEGNTNLDLQLDARTTPKVRLQLFADDLPLSTLLETAGATTSITGDLSLDVKLESRGHSAHEFASNLQGHFHMMAENSRIPRYYFDLLAADILGWALSKTAPSQKEARLDCSILTLSVDKGIAKSETLVLDGRDSTVTGSLSLDLGQETIDLQVFPERKTRLWGRLDPVRVSGPWSDPQVTAISKKEVVKTYGTLLLLPQLFVGEKALGYVSGLLSFDAEDEESPCQKLEQSLK